MEKHIDIDALAARLRPIVGDNGALHPHTIDKLRPHLWACPVPAAVHLLGEQGVRLINAPMAQLTGTDVAAPTVPLHLMCPMNVMAYHAMSHHFGTDTRSPFAHLVCMGSGAAPSALLWQVRHVGRAVGHAVLLSGLMPLVPAMAVGGAAPAQAIGVMARLSPREREVLRLLAADLSNEEVARVLSIAMNTLATHKKAIMRKLGARHIMGLLGKMVPSLGE